MKTMICSLLFLLTASIGAGQDPALSAKKGVLLPKGVGFVPAVNPVPTDSFAEVTLTGLTDKQAASIFITPEPTKQVDVESEDKESKTSTMTVYFRGKDKSYTVIALIFNFETRKITQKRLVVNFDQAVIPEPDPNPNPNPKPIPPPSGKVTRFAIVEESSKASAWRGDVLGSSKVQSLVKTKGLKHLLVEIDEVTDNPVIKEFQKLAKGKELPWLFQLDDSGKILDSRKAPIDPDAFVAVFGTNEVRKLGMKVGKPKLQWKVFGEAENVPLIPREQWKPIHLKAYLPPVYDQNGKGQCNASAICTAMEGCMILAGMPAPHLSAGDIYRQINGGVDEGSMLEDGLEAAMKNGVATVKYVPYVWDGKRNNQADAATLADRKQYMVVEAYLCPSFDAMASALQQGFFVIHGLLWYDNFTVDKDGWLPASGRGGMGGHALCGYGIAQRNGKWGILTRNSWSESWGGSANGTPGVGAGDCVIPESLFSRDITGYWAIRVVKKSVIDFPVPVSLVPKKLNNPLTEYTLAP